jgi:LPS export ABC transporter protein LptC
MRRDPQQMDEKIHQLNRKKIHRRYFKYAVFSFIFLSLSFVFVWPYLEKIPHLFLKKEWGGGHLQFEKIDLEKKFIEHPKYVGGGSHPYTLTADRAQQTTKDKITLENVKARITLKDGIVLSILANKGDIQTENQKHAHLYGDVNFIYEKGDTELWTQSVFINMKDGFLETSDEVEGESLYGVLRGSRGMYIHQNKSFYKLKGPSDLMIHGKEKE